MHLEALAVHNGGAALVVLPLGDPHLLEGAQGGQNGSTNPNAVLSLRGGHDLDLHCGRCQRSQLLGHALADAHKHGRAAGQHHVGVQVLSDIDITLPWS